MFEWLPIEASKIKTNKFFVFDKNVDQAAIDRLQDTVGKIPEDYATYLRLFGDSRMYRSQMFAYTIVVHSKWHTYYSNNGIDYFEFGCYGNSGAYFAKKANSNIIQSAVFEGMPPGLRKVSDSFEEWSKKRFAAAKKKYGKREWKKIEDGPEPFTEQELEVIKAMYLFTFEKVGIAPDGDVLVKVRNGSPMRLTGGRGWGAARFQYTLQFAGWNACQRAVKTSQGWADENRPL